MNEGCMSGCQMRQYLHISTRKMKYLLDNGYIPCVNNGQATHKYCVRIEDVEAFRVRCESEPGFLSELSGMFSSCRTSEDRADEACREPAPAMNSEQLREYLAEKWKDYPDAVPSDTAAKMTGLDMNRLCRLAGRREVQGVVVGKAMYYTKESLIAWAAENGRLGR